MWWIPAAAVAADTFAEEEGRGLLRVEPEVTVAAPAVVLRGGTVLTAAGQRFHDGYVVITDGRISAVGAGAPPAVEGATVIDVHGDVITPGIIDTHSHLGVYPAPNAAAHEDGNEATAPTTPGVWAEHSLWPQDPGFELAVAGGVTAMQVLPGSANLIGGRGVVVRPVPARGSRAMRFPGAPETVKMACGENPKRVYGERSTAPSTRMGNLRGQREAFLAAQAYARRWKEYERNAPDDEPEEDEEDEGRKRKKSNRGQWHGQGGPPERDLDLETLVGVMEGAILAQVHCYMADDMLSMLQLADEFGFEVRSFHHATEAYKIRDILASREVAASVWADWWGFKIEAYDAVPEGAALLSEAGARAIIHSDSAVGIQRLNQEAAKGFAAGTRAGIRVTEDDALRWITANPAWALGIDGETGTLEVGKRGDVVVWAGHPFSVYGEPRLVFIDGALRFDRARPQVWSDFSVGQEVIP